MKNNHELKTHPPEFQVISDGLKTAEFRRNDRIPGFDVGDVLLLQEYDPSSKEYTGRELRVVVTHALHGPRFGVPAGFVVLSIQRVEDRDTEAELVSLRSRVEMLESQNRRWARFVTGR